MSRIYGRNGTIHHTKLLNIEVDAAGKVVSVWFRCALLPFDVTVVKSDRAHEMRAAYRRLWPALIAIEVEDPSPEEGKWKF